MFMARSRMYRQLLGKGVALALILPLLLNGCAKLAPKTTQVNYYPACYAPINKLREENKKFASTVAAGIIIGGLIGAGLGLALGGGRGVSAGIGALAGAAGGAALGYAIAKQKQIKDDQQRRASIAGDIDLDISSMDSIALASIQARQCYTSQFDLELARYKGGEIGKAEFLERAKEIVSGLNEIAALLKSSESGSQDKLLQYKAAVDSEYKKAGEQAPPLVAEKRVEAASTPAPAPEPEPAHKRKSKTKGKTKKAKADQEQTVTPQPAAASSPASQTAAKADAGQKAAQCAPLSRPAYQPLPEGQSLEGGAKRCDVMAGLRDELKTEGELATAKASDCQRITQEISLEMKSEWLPGGGVLTDLAPHAAEGALCQRPRG